MGTNKQIVFAPEINVNSNTNERIALNPDMQLLMLLMGDFIHFMKTNREQEGVQLLPYIGRLISHVGLPPMFQELICNQRPLSLN